MHPSSYNKMKEMTGKYLDQSQTLSILDIGSYDVNGSYKDIFSNENWNYVGVDISAGPNVDIVSEDPYKWEVEDNSFDFVISGQCLEHVKKPWLWIKEVERVLKYGGITVLIVPWQWDIHRVPVDCWRILPDGMEVLFSLCPELQMISCDVNARDTVGFSKKGSILQKEFEIAKKTKTDIYEHLDVLKNYADQCNHVTEFGVRTAMSSVAFLASKSETVTSYDIHKKDRAKYIENICEIEKRPWNLIIESSLEAVIEETDFLFMDSCHTYEHLKKELEIHSHKAKKFIGFHDTKSFAEKGEKENSGGILPAINEFLENKEWKILEDFPNNNGLMIIGK